MKHKLSTIGFSYLVGLICASFLSRNISLAVSAGLLILSVVLWFAKKKSIAVGAFVGAIAFGVSALYTMLTVEPIEQYYGKEIPLTAVILEKSNPSNDNCAYIMQTEIDGISTKITLYGADSQAECGDNVEFTAKLSPFTDSADFSETSYYKSQGVTSKAIPTSDLMLIKQGMLPFSFISDYREHIKSRIKSTLTGDEGDIICAMFLGDKSGMSDEMKLSVKRSGISHFTAVSGLHLTICAHIIMLFLGATKLKKRFGIQFFILTATILWFMIFFNLSMSVIRSGIMLIIFYGAKPLHRKGDTLNSIGCAALVILLFSPYACMDIGFLMSISGTLGVGVVAPKVCAVFKSMRFANIRNAVIGTVCASLCTLPLCTIFGGVSVISPITNLILLPFFMVIMLCLVLFTFVGGFGSALLFGAGVTAKVMLILTDFFSSLKYAYIPLGRDFEIPFFFAASCFIIIVLLIWKDTEKAVKAAIVSISAFAAMIILYNFENLYNTQIEIYSDGNSGAVMVSDNKASCVIASDSSAKTISAVKEYLSDRFMDKLNVVVVENDTKNNLSAWSSINCDLLILPNETGSYDISGSFVLNVEKEYTFLTANGLRISLSSIKSDIPNADISVVYGYKMSYPETNNTYNIYINKRMNNAMNAYYNNISFIAKSDGSIRILEE